MPPGMGKTRSWLEVIKETGDRTLIIAPKLVCMDTWPRESKKWGYNFFMRFMHGPQRHLRGKEQVSLINYDAIPWLVEKLKEHRILPYKQVIFDEVSKMKNPQSKRFLAWDQIGEKFDYRMGGTGTPVGAHLVDLFGEMYVCDGGRSLGKDYDRFKRRYFSYDEYTRKLEPYHNSEEQILDRMRGSAISFDINDLNMPPLKHIPHYLALPDSVRDAYTKMHEDFVVADLDLYAANAAVKSGKLRQIASGGVIDINGSRRVLHDAKAERLRDILDEHSGRPVMVFFEFQSDYEAICRMLKREVPALYGKTRARDAAKFVKQWNAGKLPVIAMHPRCLHPDTLVLTEHRGWVPMITVRDDERVFDGVEYVSHEGCRLSGTRPVIDKFGIRMTPDHRILIKGKWVQAQHVPNTESARREACYGVWSVGENGLRRVSELQSATRDAFTGCSEKQHPQEPFLPRMSRQKLSSNDAYAAISNMEGYAGSHIESEYGQLSELRRTRHSSVQTMVDFHEFLGGHARRLFRYVDHRAKECKRALLQRKLSLGNRDGAACEQAKQPHSPLSRHAPSSRGILSPDQRDTWCDNTLPEHVRRSGNRSTCIPQINISETSPEPVYDLVNCGPRNRFAVRNATGEVFIVHNSAAYGLNMQDSGNVLVWYTIPWSFEMLNQGTARLWRQGQQHKVLCYYLIVQGTEDERVFNRVEERGDTHDRVMKGLL